MPILKKLATPDRYEYIEKFRNARNVVVHSSVFHADDVFTVAYLKMLREFYKLPPLNIYRLGHNGEVRPSMTLDNGWIVADVGKGEFDHHFKEEDKAYRENGNPYAAFGLIVRAFHQGFLNEEEYDRLDTTFIQPIDYHDNYGTSNMLSSAISTFNLNWDAPDRSVSASNECFCEAVEIAYKILSNAISSARSIVRAKELAKKQTITGHTIFMDKYAPVMEYFTYNPDVEFIGSPSDKRGYQVIGVKDATKNNKRLFPEAIRGISTVDPDEHGLLFCHPSGFMATFDTKEHAMKFMAEYMED